MLNIRKYMKHSLKFLSPHFGDLSPFPKYNDKSFQLIAIEAVFNQCFSLMLLVLHEF